MQDVSTFTERGFQEKLSLGRSAKKEYLRATGGRRVRPLRKSVRIGREGHTFDSSSCQERQTVNVPVASLDRLDFRMSKQPSERRIVEPAASWQKLVVNP